MGRDVAWFNHDKREVVQPRDLPANNRFHFTGHPSACAFYVLMRGRWNGDRVQMVPDEDDAYYDLREVYADVTPALVAEFAKERCFCVKGQTPDDPRDPRPCHGCGAIEGKSLHSYGCPVSPRKP